MVKKWNLSKKLEQPEMLILLAKRNARQVNLGRKTVFFKNGQVIDDERLDRFGNRDFIKAAAHVSPSASKLELHYDGIQALC
jgi:hypothetical protein